MAVGYADHGFFEVCFFVAHGVVHRAVGRTRLTFGDVFGAGVQNDGEDGFGFHGGLFVSWGCVFCSAEYATGENSGPIYF